MKLAIKGALWSGLVFPGLGQVVLKHYPRGLAFMAGALASTVYIVKTAVDEVMRSLPALDPAGIANLPVTPSAQIGPGLWLLGLCWLWSALDAYWIGSKLDRQG